MSSERKRLIDSQFQASQQCKHPAAVYGVIKHSVEDGLLNFNPSIVK